jgi:hypothetical protein
MLSYLQETKEKIGTIVDVHNSGASDLLRVQLTASRRGKDVLIWIPFVKDIVPVVDIAAKRVEITPPEGLLDLNVPMGGLTRKEMKKQVQQCSIVLVSPLHCSITQRKYSLCLTKTP